MGNKLNSAGSGGVDYSALGLAVWNVLLADVNIPSSTGDQIKKALTLSKFIALKD